MLVEAASGRRSRASTQGLASSPIEAMLARLHAELSGVDDGDVATYIPELSNADPAWFGMCVATIDGQVSEVGDAAQPFTIQSISKPFVFGMALEDRGVDAVARHVGVEPSGNPFNAVVVDPLTSRPFNPMVNAGAIVTTALVGGDSLDDRLDRVQSVLSTYAGRPLPIDERVCASERATGDRNRALGWLMSSFGMLEHDVEETLEVYFNQCAVEVTCRDLAVMAATLANGGVNPITQERAIDARYVANVLSVMTTCGMYDSAGEWVYTVGLPAKSGVAGGVIAVLPGQLGIGVFSPRLDGHGNSVRGVAACRRLSSELQLHLLRAPSSLRSVVRRSVRGSELRSSRVRSAAEDARLAEHRDAIVLHELQGDLCFASAEMAYRAVDEQLDGVDLVVVDFGRVGHVDEPAITVLRQLEASVVASGRTFVAVRAPEGLRGGQHGAPDAVRQFADADTALEWCEESLLDDLGLASSRDAVLDLAQFDLLSGVEAEEREAIEHRVDVRAYEAGSHVFEQGAPADGVAFLLEGRVSVRLAAPAVADFSRTAGREPSMLGRRLATFGPGVTVGEMALLGETTRSADVICDEPSRLAFLSVQSLRAIEADHPSIGRHIEANIARVLAARLRAANAQIQALER